MEPFLKTLAEWTTARFGNDYSGVKVIFPNKRSGVFFRHYLSEIIKTPVWAPEISDIDTFIATETGFTKADINFQVFQLYEIFVKIFEKNNISGETIDRFYPWGKIILKDFSEIDKNLVKAADVFKYISNIKTIDQQFDSLDEEQIDILKSFWSHLDIEKRTAEKEKFLNILKLLPDVYHLLGEKQIVEKISYEGFYYKVLVEKIISKTWQPACLSYLFAGFNLLNKSEKAIFKFLKENNNVFFFWDYDLLFLEKEDFIPYQNIKENLKLFPPPENFKPVSGTPIFNKSIKVTGASLLAGQAKAAVNTLIDNKIDHDNPETAIVLSDEKLLIPLLHSLPDEFSNTNITMGFPVMQSYIADFVKVLFGFYQHFPAEGKLFYYKNITRLLRHPFITRLNPEMIQFLIEEIEKQNLWVIDKTKLLHIHSYFENLLEYDNNNSIINKIVSLLKDYLQLPLLSLVEKEILNEIYKNLQVFSKYISEKQITINHEMTQNILDQLLKSIKVPFSGEPLSGVQIMGSLETRCLDFKNLIILSMNEGIWPATIKEPSFISYQVRKVFRLTTQEHDDQVYAYYFYRLLQRAENIFIFYNTEPDISGGSEKSRYLLQLKYDFKINLYESTFGFPVKPGKYNEIIFKKEGIVAEKLNQYKGKNAKYLSPSALIAYLDCSLKFCLIHLFGIKEYENVKEEIDAPMMGNIVHQCMAKLYQKGSYLTKEDLQKYKKDYPEFVDTIIKEDFLKVNKDKEITGINILVSEAIKSYILRVIEYDLQYAPFNIVSLEETQDRLKAEIDFSTQDGFEKATISGIIDRIDNKEGIYRIVDYKTGVEQNNFSSIEELFLTEIDNRKKAIFQILLYCYMFYRSTASSVKIKPVLYIINKMNDKKFTSELIFNDNKNSSYIVEDFKPFNEEFEKHLKLLLQNIFNVNTDFRQCSNQNICKYCTFKKLCNRNNAD